MFDSEPYKVDPNYVQLFNKTGFPVGSYREFFKEGYKVVSIITSSSGQWRVIGKDGWMVFSEETSHPKVYFQRKHGRVVHFQDLKVKVTSENGKRKWEITTTGMSPDFPLDIELVETALMELFEKYW